MDRKELASEFESRSSEERTRRNLLREADQINEIGRTIVSDFRDFFMKCLPGEGEDSSPEATTRTLVLNVAEAEDEELGPGIISATIKPLDRRHSVDSVRNEREGWFISEAAGFLIEYRYVPKSEHQEGFEMTPEEFLDGYESDDPTEDQIAEWSPPTKGSIRELRDYVKDMRRAVGKTEAGTFGRKALADRTLKTFSEAALDPELNLELSHRLRRRRQREKAGDTAETTTS